MSQPTAPTVSTEAVRALIERYTTGVDGLKKQIIEIEQHEQKLRSDLVATLGAIKGLEALLAPPPAPPAEPVNTEEPDAAPPPVSE